VPSLYSVFSGHLVFLHISAPYFLELRAQHISTSSSEPSLQSGPQLPLPLALEPSHTHALLTHYLPSLHSHSLLLQVFLGVVVVVVVVEPPPVLPPVLVPPVFPPYGVPEV